jgi:hypothetical protein
MTPGKGKEILAIYRLGLKNVHKALQSLSATYQVIQDGGKRANGGNEPPNPRQFFGQTLEANYGLQDLDQKYWDT